MDSYECDDCGEPTQVGEIAPCGSLICPECSPEHRDTCDDCARYEPEEATPCL